MAIRSGSVPVKTITSGGSIYAQTLFAKIPPESRSAQELELENRNSDLLVIHPAKSTRVLNSSNSRAKFRVFYVCEAIDDVIHEVTGPLETRILSLEFHRISDRFLVGLSDSVIFVRQLDYFKSYFSPKTVKDDRLGIYSAPKRFFGSPHVVCFLPR